MDSLFTEVVLGARTLIIHKPKSHISIGVVQDTQVNHINQINQVVRIQPPHLILGNYGSCPLYLQTT